MKRLLPVRLYGGTPAALAVALVIGMPGVCSECLAQASGAAQPQGQIGANQVTGGEQTPAERKYGPASNPIVGGPVDLDLTKPLTIERAVAIALARQDAIAIAKSQADSAAAGLTQALSAYYPQVTPSYQFQTTLAPISANGQTVSARSQSVTDGIVAKQLIFDTGRREAAVGSNRRSLYAAEYGLADQRQTVILTVTQDYYDLLRDIELVRVQDTNVRLAQTTLDSVKAKVAVGTAAAVDPLQAESGLDNARVALLEAQNARDLAQAALKNAMGVVSDHPLVLATQQVAPPSATPDTRTLQNYVDEAYAHRMDVMAQQERVNASGYAVRLARINAGLSVDATVAEGYQVDPVTGEERQFLVTFSYPLFDAGNTHAAVQSSEAGLRQEQRTLDQLEQSVHLDVEDAYVTKEEARQRVVAAQTAVTAGQSNYDAALGKQRFGQGTVLDVINAEVQLVTAQVNLVQAIYDFYTSDAALQRAIGANDPAYLPRVPAGRVRASTADRRPAAVRTAAETPGAKSGPTVGKP